MYFLAIKPCARTYWPRVRIKGVQAGTERIGDFAFIHKHRHLRIADRQLASVLYFAVLHRITVGKDSIFRFDPFDDVDKLLRYDIAKTHVFAHSPRTKLRIVSARDGMLRGDLPCVNHGFAAIYCRLQTGDTAPATHSEALVAKVRK